MIRQMATTSQYSSAYVHLPAGTPFFVGRLKRFSAWKVREELTSTAVYLTQDGWIFSDWQVLLPYEIVVDTPQLHVASLKPGNDGIWRYTFNNEERPYPLLCRPVNWAELELLHTFS